MKTWVVVVGVLFFMVLLITDTNAKKNNGNRGRNAANGTEGVTLECLGQKLEETKLNYALTECTDEILHEDKTEKASKGRRKSLKKNLMCIKLCQRKKQGILDPNGKLSERATQFIDDLFPQKARSRIQRGLNRCADINEEGFSTLNNCKDYKKFEKCMMRIITKTCGWKNGKPNHGGGRNGSRQAKRRGNKGKNKGNRKQNQDNTDDHVDDDDSEIEE